MLKREQSAGYMTNWAGRLLIRTITPKLEVHGLTVGYLPVFFALSANPTLTQKQIVEDHRCRAADDGGHALAHGARRSHQRTPDPADGRSSLISLTPKAREQLAAVETAVNETNAIALSGLTPAERKQFFVIMGKIVAALGGE